MKKYTKVHIPIEYLCRKALKLELIININSYLPLSPTGHNLLCNDPEIICNNVMRNYEILEKKLLGYTTINNRAALATLLYCGLWYKNNNGNYQLQMPTHRCMCNNFRTIRNMISKGKKLHPIIICE